MNANLVFWRDKAGNVGFPQTRSRGERAEQGAKNQAVMVGSGLASKTERLAPVQPGAVASGVALAEPAPCRFTFANAVYTLWLAAALGLGELSARPKP